MGRKARRHVLKGERYGRWTVLEVLDERVMGRSLCKCDCGTTREVTNHHLLTGASRSCGCIAADKARAGKYGTTHGLSHTRLFTVWVDMLQRCYNKNCSAYKHYGQRGITVCDEWHDFANFHSWAMASGYDENAPKGQCTLDRINVDEGYSPENCRWADLYQQANNRSDTVYYLVNGERLTTPQIARKYGVSESTIRQRVIRGWTIEEAINAPIGTRSAERDKNCGKNRAVVAFDADGNIVGRFASVVEAASEYGCCGATIRRSCAGMKLRDLDVTFAYDEDATHSVRSSCKKLDMLDMDGNYIRTFESVRDAARFCGKTCHTQISNCCNGKAASAFVYKWRFTEGSGDVV